MTFQTDSKNKGEEDISLLIEELHDDIMIGAFSMVKAIKGGKKIDREKLDSQKELIAQFKVIKNTYIGYLALQKAGGKVNPSHLSDVANRIREIKSNMGNVVATVPIS